MCNWVLKLAKEGNTTFRTRLGAIGLCGTCTTLGETLPGAALQLGCGYKEQEGTAEAAGNAQGHITFSCTKVQRRRPIAGTSTLES